MVQRIIQRFMHLANSELLAYPSPPEEVQFRGTATHIRDNIIQEAMTLCEPCELIGRSLTTEATSSGSAGHA